MRPFSTLALAAFALAAVELPAQSVNIAATQSTIGTFFGNHNTSLLFDLGASDVTVTGSIDLSNLATDLSDNSVLFVGLISKVDYDKYLAGTSGCGGCPTTPGANFFGFLATAYAGFQYTDNNGFVGRVGQRTMGGETLQGGLGAINSVLGNGDFSIVFSQTGITLDVGGTDVFQAYGETANGPTDFSQGAYAFAGAFMNRDGANVTFDLTFSGVGTSVVPEPSTVALVAFGGLALVGLRRRQSRAA